LGETTIKENAFKNAIESNKILDIYEKILYAKYVMKINDKNIK